MKNVLLIDSRQSKSENDCKDFNKVAMRCKRVHTWLKKLGGLGSSPNIVIKKINILIRKELNT